MNLSDLTKSLCMGTALTGTMLIIPSAFAGGAMIIDHGVHEIVGGLTPTRPSPWDLGTDGLVVGSVSNGYVTVQDGGHLKTTSSVLGHFRGSEGAITVSGDGATWEDTGVLFIGREGNGSLLIEDGGRVTSLMNYIGDVSGGLGSVRVSGDGSIWEAGEFISIGEYGGSGVLQVSDGGTVRAKEIYLGSTNNTYHNNQSAELIIGGGFIEDPVTSDVLLSQPVAAGRLETDKIVFAAPSSTLVLNHVNEDYELQAGFSGQGTILAASGVSTLSGSNFDPSTFDITNHNPENVHSINVFGGVLNIEGAIFGEIGTVTSSSHDTATTNVTGDWYNLSTIVGMPLAVNSPSKGELNVTEGGTVVSRTTNVAYGPKSEGTINVSGKNNETNKASRLISYYSLDVASNTPTYEAGKGNLNITAGGQVDVGNFVFIGERAYHHEITNVVTKSIGGVSVDGEGSALNVGVRFPDYDPSQHPTSMSVYNGLLSVSNGASVNAPFISLGSTNGHGISTSGKLIVGAAAGEAAVAPGYINIQDIFFESSSSALIFNHNIIGDQQYEFSANLNGNDIHIEQYAGNTYLSGDNSGIVGTLRLEGGLLAFDSGQFNIQSGAAVIDSTLIVGTSSDKKSASIGSDIELGSGGFLGGHGIIAGSVINNGGIVGPGNSIGNLTVEQNYSGKGTLEIEVASTPVADSFDVTADQLKVNGTADFSQTTLSLLFSPQVASGWSFDPIEPMIVVDLAGDVHAANHEFMAVMDDLLFMDTALDYTSGDGNDIELSLVRNDIDFEEQAITKNQRATAKALASIRKDTDLFRSVVMNVSDEATARELFEQFSGEGSASIRNALLEDTLIFRQAISARTQASKSALATGGTQNATHAGYSFWSQGYGHWGNQDGTVEVSGATTVGGGLLIGVDSYVSSDLQIGALAGFGSSFTKVGDLNTSAEVDSYTLGGYGDYAWDKLSVSAGLINTWNQAAVTRKLNVNNGQLSDKLSSRQNINAFQGFAEVGYGIEFEATKLQPFMGTAVVNVFSDGFTESGQVAALKAESQSSTIYFATLGLRGQTSFSLNETSISTYGLVAWQHASTDGVKLEQSFVQGSDSFAVIGSPLAQDQALLEAGVSIGFGQDTQLGLHYAGQLAASTHNHGVNARLDWKF
ncbi:MULTISPECIES: autotransporter domain-containing protein [unclassified Pseudovibrio]|uniref:autotransporter domain-containing protein n=1 Tax=unclassified Pseudovibrio TaxID=2627060 RepID=UPI0007B272F2|nr:MULTISPECIES: autotransporter domain-containing protein [unclassified Pseudovibrio]KZK95190.1 Extracellular serine protease precursor [Pseudovibrio sp. W74]KZL09007.1 Extracellular serine protease precursor [Pseudovibrio sp. Ad14]